VSSRRVTINTAQRMRDQLEYLDLQIVSADIYGNQELEEKLRRERRQLFRKLGVEDQD
jgi:hypothetical protein